MIGIILWSDAAEGKAVIWCEDQGDLAYYSESSPTAMYDSFFDVGDVVEFDFTTQRNTRLASNPRWVKQNASTTLNDGLRAMPMMEEHVVSTTAKVIPFRAEPTPQVAHTKAQATKRLG
ncbi:MAG: hypothetical protein AAF252_03960 [Pseudomonadota bacterium]